MKAVITFQFTLLLGSITVNTFAQATEDWAERFNGTGNSIDIGRSAAADIFGNTIVTGNSIGIGTGSDMKTIKYNSAGIQQWDATYNGPQNGGDIANSITVDIAGNIYVTGRSGQGIENGSDYTTIKYNPAGIQQWVSLYNGTGSAFDEALAVLIDKLGNVYVTGYSMGSGTNFDFATVKYNSGGNLQWASRYNGPGNNEDIAYSLCLDISGNLYIAGGSIGSSSGYDFTLVKYNSSGVQQWERRFNGSNNGGDVATSITTDGLGNVYATGFSDGGGIVFYEFVTIKYNSNGVQQWLKKYNGPVFGFDAGRSIAVSESGDVYVTGESIGSGTFYDYATVKYSSSGIEQWVARYNDPSNGSDQSKSIALDCSGNAYVTGFSTSSETGMDYTTIKYSSSGTQVWAEGYNGPANSTDQALSVAYDGLGIVYVTGGSSGIGTSFDMATIRYSQEDLTPPTEKITDLKCRVNLFKSYGILNHGQANALIVKLNAAVHSINHGNNNTAINELNAFINQLNAYVNSGLLTSAQAQPMIDYALITIDQLGGDNIIAEEMPYKFKLEQNYPNPFNASSKIKMQISKLSDVKLTVFDVQGREVAVLVNEELKAGSYEVDFDGTNYPSGTYLYKLTTDGFTETKKMVLIK